MSVGSARTVLDRMSAREFRAFQAGRPDHERWELIRGVPIMMTPPTIAHNRIAGNLERLLNAALAAHDPTRIANQRPGIELGRLSEDYLPEPDVAVIEADYQPDQRFVSRAYLLAEVASITDYELVLVPGSDEAWIDVKRRLYLSHHPCKVVLIIEQDRIEIRIDRRAKEAWTSTKLTGLADQLVLPEFGLRCLVADLYEGTPLHPGHRRRRT
jgi:Uma2 family endonuclease